MKDIGVYTKMETLEHKIQLSKRKRIFPFWTVPFPGKNSLEERLEDDVIEGSTIFKVMPKKIWFASNGAWQGYFDITNIRENKVDMGVWHPIKAPKKYPRVPFRGFTYRVPSELMEKST